jgi:GT2 family glycosyltransferase
MYSRQRHSEGYAGVKSPARLVIPCYNGEAALSHLLASLETIQKESNIPVRVLLVDGGSQESSDCNRRSRLRELARILP